MKKTLLACLGAALLSCVLVVEAGAGTIHPGTEMDFSSGKNHPGGLVSYAPALGASLSITNAPINVVEQFPTYSSFPVMGGYLDLVTGPCVAGCQYNAKSQTTSSRFADGGLIQIFGSVPGLAGDPHGLLFQGVFDHNDGSKLFGQKSCGLTSVTLNGKTGKGGVNGCIEVDYLNPILLADLGFKEHTGKGFLSTMELQLTFLHGHWTGELASSDLLVRPTPEPASLILVGSGLSVLAAAAKRKKTRNS